MFEMFNSIDWDLYKSIDWDVYKDVLTYGDPPIYVQLLVFIGLLVAIKLWRIFTKAPFLSKTNALKYKILSIFVFFAILLQEQYDLQRKIDTLRDVLGT